MAYAPFIPNTEQWTKYFLEQVQGKHGSRGVTSDGPIGGGITTMDDPVRLTTVGRVQAVKVKGQPAKTVKVQITSPAEVALEQAEAELENIKESNGVTDVIPKAASKRKASQKSKKNNQSAKSVKRKRYNDVFSK